MCRGTGPGRSSRSSCARRSQRTRAVLTFFAQDHATADIVGANADLTKAEQAAEIIAFADYWQQATGTDPGLLVFDSQLTTYKILGQLSGRGIRWLTLRQRGKTELTRLAELAATAWTSAVIAHSGRYRRPRLHEDLITLPGISTPVRQIAVKNIGRDEPALIITNDLTAPAKNLLARYAERMMAENELDAYIGGSSSTAYLHDPAIARTRRQNLHELVCWHPVPWFELAAIATAGPGHRVSR